MQAEEKMRDEWRDLPSKIIRRRKGKEKYSDFNEKQETEGVEGRKAISMASHPIYGNCEVSKKSRI